MIGIYHNVKHGRTIIIDQHSAQVRGGAACQQVSHG